MAIYISPFIYAENVIVIIKATTKHFLCHYFVELEIYFRVIKNASRSAPQLLGAFENTFLYLVTSSPMSLEK